MTPEDAGHYRAKHPDGTRFDPSLADELTARAQDGKITCTAAHELATERGVEPSEVGKTADLLEYRIVECQMGLFGYYPDKRIVRPAEHVPNELQRRLSEIAADGCITCAECWSLAQKLGVEKMAVSSACESLKLKIKSCQLGAFWTDVQASGTSLPRRRLRGVTSEMSVPRWLPS